MKHYIKNLLIGFDQFINTILNGEPDETLSSRSYRLGQRYWYANAIRIFIDTLFFIFERDHCYKSYLSELERKQFPEELR